MKIAYLAPEIPALSATFVYNEILQLEKIGHDVVPFSIHKPRVLAQDDKLTGLRARVRYLYQRSKRQVLQAHFFLLMKKPCHYFKTLMKLASDIKTVGLFSRNARGLIYRFFYSASLAEDLVRSEVEHLHVHFAHVPADIAMYAAEFSNINFSITAHANDLFERAWLLKEKVDRSAFFATISSFNRDFLTDLGADSQKVRIVRCGVDDNEFRQRTDFVTGAVATIGVIGRLVEKKGIDTLIEAVHLLKQRKVAVKLAIAGSGPLEMALRALSEKLGLDETDVAFLGAMEHDNVGSFIKTLALFVLPCKQDKQGDMDGIPVVLMESMLSGVPVISSRVSGIPELVIDNETGLLVEQGDSAGLADAVCSILNDAPLRERLIKNGISLVRKEFSLVNNTEKLSSLFQQNIDI